jgi:Pyruvate/2-oxoacid:ferredoxin oxidoreductase delta subunit
MAHRKIAPFRKKKIKKLLSLMNKQNVRFIPVAPPLVDMMDLVVEDEELDFLITMGTELYDFEQIKSLSGMTESHFQTFFGELQRKGYVHVGCDRHGNDEYSLAPIAIGWYETMMHYSVGKQHEKEFSEKWNEFFKFFQKFNFFPLRNAQDVVMRNFLKPTQDTALMKPTEKGRKGKINLPVNTKVTHETNVYPSFLVNDLVEEYGKKESVYIFPCVCRHGNHVIGSDCNFTIPRESCMSFGPMAKVWANLGYGRYIDKEEAIDILSEVREKGAVHSVIHEKDDCNLPVMAICNCCWDCCGILKPYNMGAISLMYNASYSAQIKDGANCKTCGNCEKFCPTTAMRMQDDEMQLNKNLCIGCGQCALQCPQNNIEMYPNDRIVYLPLLKKSEARVIA